MKTHMLRFQIAFISITFIAIQGLTQPHPSHQIYYEGKSYSIYPFLYGSPPDIPSPAINRDGNEFITFITSVNMYAIEPVKVENGDVLDYKNNQWYGKGQQLMVDEKDFPSLARKGLHSEKELNNLKTITGKPIGEINSIARPQQYSGAGFIAEEEDIISVLKGDNELVKKIGKSHPEMAKPLFHVFNLIQAIRKDSERGNVMGIIYNGYTVQLKFHGAKGWQESIFNDEILGYWEIDIRRDMVESEKQFLSEKYPDLTTGEMEILVEKLSFIHTGEMVPFYIQRYGFYEGHTSYRADPIAISYIFGIKSLEEIEEAFPGKLLEILTKVYTEQE